MATRMRSQPESEEKVADGKVAKRVSRRRLLGGAGAAVAVAGVVPAWLATGLLPIGPQTTPPAKANGDHAKRQWAMVIDLRKCDGCVTIGTPPQCVEGCNAEHFVPEGQQWMAILEMDGPGGKYIMPRPCMQCENTPCTQACPVHATYHNEEGVVLIDHRRCIGCRMCMATCPYSARSFNWEQPVNPAGSTFANYSPEYPVPHRRGTVEKCMLCAHRTVDGKLPACAEACPMNAIYLGDLVEDIATNGKEVVKLSRFLSENSAFRYKEELGTRPRVWYIPGHGQEYGREASDPREPERPRSWREQGATLEGQGKVSHVGH